MKANWTYQAVGRKEKGTDYTNRHQTEKNARPVTMSMRTASLNQEKQNAHIVKNRGKDARHSNSIPMGPYRLGNIRKLLSTGFRSKNGVGVATSTHERVMRPYQLTREHHAPVVRLTSSSAAPGNSDNEWRKNRPVVDALKTARSEFVTGTQFARSAKKQEAAGVRTTKKTDTKSPQ